jgi:hypothetical protein
VASYRALALDSVTGVPVAELPLSGLSYGSKLNDAGECTAVLPLPPLDSAGGRELAAVFNDAVTEVRRQLVIERDGVPVWAGIIWASPYTDEVPGRQVRAAEWWSYFRRRVVLTFRNYEQVDQLTIARQLLGDALAVSAAVGQDMGFSFDANTSGVLRDRTYPALDRLNVGEVVEQLSAVINGFDFAVDVRWGADGLIDKRVRTHYPRRGRPWSETGLTFELGRNVTDFSWPSDGTRYANVVHVLGAGESPRALRSARFAFGEVFAASAGGIGAPIVEEVISRTDVSRLSTLGSIAEAALAARARPVVVPEITVRADFDPLFGSYVVGDSCRVRIQAGVSPRFPDGLDVLRRIIGWTVVVSDEGSELVRLSLGEDFDG